MIRDGSGSRRWRTRRRRSISRCSGPSVPGPQSSRTAVVRGCERGSRYRDCRSTGIGAGRAEYGDRQRRHAAIPASAPRPCRVRARADGDRAGRTSSTSPLETNDVVRRFGSAAAIATSTGLRRRTDVTANAVSSADDTRTTSRPMTSGDRAGQERVVRAAEQQDCRPSHRSDRRQQAARARTFGPDRNRSRRARRTRRTRDTLRRSTLVRRGSSSAIGLLVGTARNGADGADHARPDPVVGHLASTDLSAGLDHPDHGDPETPSWRVVSRATAVAVLQATTISFGSYRAIIQSVISSGVGARPRS